MKTVTIYHNPRCSKSRESLALLKKNSFELEIIEYLNAPPSKTRLRQLAGMLEGGAPALLRAKEELCKTLGLSASSPSAKIIEAIAEHPILLERPLVVCEDRAAIGRPPEAVLEIL